MLKPVKLQQFYIFKFESGRLKDYGYNINVSVDEATKNNEIVSIGESQVIRTLLRLKNKEIEQDEISNLFFKIKKIKRMTDNEVNRFEISRITDEINEMLFIPEIISIVFENKSHYKMVIKDGVFINGKKFKRFLAGSGNLRKNTVFFCDEDFNDDLVRILENGYNKKVKLVPSKFNAYFALANSATYDVSFPRICVVRDSVEIKRKTVDYVVETEDCIDDKIEEREVDLEMNYFDGQGLVSPRFSKIWATELGMDFTPSSFIIRSSFMKGMVCTFDFNLFSKKIAKNKIVTDIWGDKKNLDDIDVILTESQFKLWYCYDSIDSYISLCNENGIGFGISRVSPKRDKTNVFSNYQFNQVLDLESDEQIKNICKPTIDWISLLSQGNPNFTILYFLGNMVDDMPTEDILDKIYDPVTKALIINKSLVNDPYIQKRIWNSTSKKIRESYLGSLLHVGNFSTMISDPYAFCEHVFGMNVSGLLSEKTYYSNFWNNRGVNKVAAMRAPLTHQSEVNILNLKNNRDFRKWYKYIHTGIIYPIDGVDCLTHADSDFDGDIIMTTDQKEFIDGAQGGNPICYDKKQSKKKIIKVSDLHKSDESGFNSRIGIITNISSSYHCLISKYENGSKEFSLIGNRLKLLRFIQGSEIDRQKGLFAKPFPEYWAKFNLTTNDESNSPLTEELKETYNDIVVKKRPYFFRYLYQSYNAKFKKHYATYDNYFTSKFGKTLNEILLSDDLSEKEKEILAKYEKFSPFINEKSTMNRICWHMESEISNTRKSSRVENKAFNFEVLLNKEIDFDEKKHLFVLGLYDEYKKNKKSIRDSASGYKNIKIFCSYIRNKALKEMSNESEVASYAAMICYKKGNPSKDFVWNCFPDGLLRNLAKNTKEFPSIPVLDTKGFFEYLGRRFSVKKINI